MLAPPRSLFRHGTHRAGRTMRQGRYPNCPQPCSLRVLVTYEGSSAPSAVHRLRSAGMQVDVVPLGEHVLDQVRALAPDVVLLAVCGQGSAGVAFVRNLRNLPGRPGIVLLADGVPAELCLADDFVSPCADPAEVVLRVEVVAARRALPETDASVQAGPVWIDPDARRV